MRQRGYGCAISVKAISVRAGRAGGQDESLGRYIVSYPMGDIRQMRDLVQGFLTNTDAWVIEDKGSEKIVGSGS